MIPVRFPSRKALAVLTAGLALVVLPGCLDGAGPSQGRLGGPFLDCSPCSILIPPLMAQPFEVDVAVNPNDPRHIVVAAVEMPHVYDPRDESAAAEFWTWIVVHTSFDGGETWQSTRMPGGLSAGPTHPLATSNQLTDATVTITKAGTVLVSGMGMPRYSYRAGPAGGPNAEADTFPPAKVFVARSHDGGLSFPDIQVIHEGLGVGVPGFGPIWQQAPDKPWIVASGDQVMLAFTRISLPGVIDGPDLFTFHVMATTSQDDGLAWTPPETLAGPTHEIAYPMRAPDGDWLVKFLQISGGLQTTLEGVESHLAIGRPGPEGWDLEVGPSTTFATSAMWSAAVVSEGGRETILVPHGAPTPEGRLAIVVERSQDRGTTWEEPVVIDDLPEGSWPVGNAAAAPDGTLYVLYLAWPEDAGPDAPYEVRLAAVRGRTVHGPIVLETGLDGAPSYRGHYNGVAAAEDGVAVVWTGGAADNLVHRFAHVRLA